MKNFMKKIANLTFTVLTFALILVVLTACAGQEGGAAGPVDSQAIEDNEYVEDSGLPEDNEIEDNGAEEDNNDVEDNDVAGNNDLMQAHAMYIAAEQAIMDAGSMLVTSVTNTVMHIEGQIVDSTANSTLSMVFHGTDDFDMMMEMVTILDLPEGPMEIPMTTYYRDGTVYIYMDGEGIKMDLAMEDVMDLAESGLIDFDESAILMQEVNEVDGGTELSFILDSEAMSDMIDGMLAGMGHVGAGIAMDGDIEFTVLLDENGDIQAVDMWMSMSYEDDGEVIFTMEMNQVSVYEIGGVTIDFPDYLDDFDYLDDLTIE